MAVKNCPFCGYHSEVMPQNPTDPYTDWAVICTGCKTTTRLYMDAEEAVEHWNKRIPQTGGT